MKKTFLQRLQQVKIKDLFHILLFAIAIIPSIIYRVTHKPFWLICDYENEARDNGYFFYKYMVENQQNQRVVYAINKSSPDYEKVKGLGEVVSHGSLMHWIMYLAASVNISSQKGGKPNAAVCYGLEISNILRNKRVFLQHGIIKDDLPYVHYENARFSLFTTSTRREFEYVNENFGYPKGIVRQLGLCRYDYLSDSSKGDKLLVMPTWRQWIAHSDYKNKNVEEAESFNDTSYYKSWMSFLESDKLNKLLDTYNKTLIFYPHRNMQRFVDDFSHVAGKRIKIASWPDYDVHQLIKECDMLITDYSSVAMDFAYLDKPVVYYQFDYEQFRRHHMEEGYFEYERDGFGEICYNEDALHTVVGEYISNQFAGKEKYLERINKFFDMRDKHNCKRTYEAIKELLDKE